MAVERDASDRPEAPAEAQLSRVKTSLLLGLLFLVNVLNLLDRQLPFILGESIKRDLGLSDTGLGLISGLAFALVYSIAAIPMARIADRSSPKWVLTAALTLWSALTAAGALAVNGAQLALARVGVAAGEAGGMPSSHAMIGAATAPQVRGRALGLFAIGTPVGVMVGMGVGGWLNDVAGWRAAMLIAGGVGLSLAAACALVLPDVRVVQARTREPSGWATIRRLLTNRGFIHLFVALCYAGIGIYGTLAFAAPALIRNYHYTTAQAGLGLGLILGIVGVVGTWVGGVLFDRGGPRETCLSVCALTFLCAAPSAFAWLAPDGWLCLLLFLPMAVSMHVYIPISFGVGHEISGPTARATATSLLGIGVSFVGASLGPLVVGAVSDVLHPLFGADSLRLALGVVAATNVCAAFHFYRAGCAVRRQREQPGAT